MTVAAVLAGCGMVLVLCLVAAVAVAAAVAAAGAAAAKVNLAGRGHSDQFHSAALARFNERDYCC